MLLVFIEGVQGLQRQIEGDTERRRPRGREPQKKKHEE